MNWLVWSLLSALFAGLTAILVSKLLTYQSLGAMSAPLWQRGLMLAPVMLAGSFLGKSLMDRIPAAIFVRMVEVIILGFGIWFLCKP